MTTYWVGDDKLRAAKKTTFQRRPTLDHTVEFMLDDVSEELNTPEAAPLEDKTEKRRNLQSGGRQGSKDSMVSNGHK